MSKKIKTALVLSVSVLFLVVLTFRDVCSAQRKIIAVVRSQVIGPYNDALAGFKKSLKLKGNKVIYSFFDLDRSQENNIDNINEIRDLEPDLILALGSEAAVYIKEHMKNIPIVFSMVLDPIESRLVKSMSSSENNLTGVCLNIGIDKQFRKIKQLLPQIKSIGMIYDGNKKVGLKNKAVSAANKLNLRIVEKAVYSEKDVPPLLNEICHETDCLWAGVDSLVYSPQLAKHILLTTLRNKMPFIAFSSHYVKAGALMAMECDYYDIGRQTAKIAIQVLQGQKPESIPIENPRRSHVVINKKTAKVIGITIPKKFLEKAEIIFE